MKRINIYPKLARSMLVLLFIMFAASTAFLILQQKFSIPRSAATSSAAVTFAFLALPLLSTMQYILNINDAEAGNHSLQDDDDLRELVAPLLIDINYEVRIGQYPSRDLNAFAISSVFGNKALIGFSSQLVETASREELLAIAAHEVTHLRHGDTRNKAHILAFNHALKVYPWLLSELSRRGVQQASIPIGLLVLAGFIAIALLNGSTSAFSFLWSLARGIAPIVLKAGLCILFFIALDYVLHRVFCSYSREREFAADAGGAEMTSPEAMMSALNLLTDPGTAVSVFDTHPPLAERKRRLLVMSSGVNGRVQDSGS
ncbi:M48 family metalloprotease [Paraburkholderia sp. LEh10]|uniref:M48 family metalloprotease n=1 Tax=Paraburkholderia sp. LEh10 TaxID=2821353 RepID=UPI001AE909C8|nr:M48 family metalloprotease [Paraburkholderia sp. LEh10]MBP0590473.1 M48 family metalloprotease [Paraburkholderia sp. LEh10]